MSEPTAPSTTAGSPSGPKRLDEAVRDARDEAVPLVLLACAALVALALVSRHADWSLLGHRLWWIWLVAAVPSAALAAMLVVGVGHLVRHDRRRAVVITLLALVVGASVVCVSVLVVSLVGHSGASITGRQLLFSGGALWLTNTVAFGLALWELDCGGPVARALTTAPRTPDIQFPQDENPTLARPAWTPRLWDYVYVSLTNSIAFSPTDAMPLTRAAKGLMAVESTLSAITILFVAARAVNILA